MAEYFYDVRVCLEITRCYDCGRWWAGERGLPGICPRCAAEELRKAHAAEQTAKRSAAAARGALRKRNK